MLRSDPDFSLTPATGDDAAAGNGRRYLELLKLCLTRGAFPERYKPLDPSYGVGKRVVARTARTVFSPLGLELVRRQRTDPRIREYGIDWPAEAETMIGLHRLDNLHECLETVVGEGVSGDVIETGVWRGGAVIFMRAALAVLGDRARLVWAADSFRGLPAPDTERYPIDRSSRFHEEKELRVSLDEVKANFARYGLLDERVRFLPGWFADTLPGAPIERLALLRMDGDLYGSTMDALVNLYPKLSPGGFAIVDDYGLPGARAAVDDYRDEHSIADELVVIDNSAAFWRRSAKADAVAFTRRA